MKQREIKFRTWDGKQMHHFDLWWNHADYLNPEDVTVMQFTGLKDKNGVEIYEGDVLEVANNKRYIIEWFDSGESGFEWYGGCFILKMVDNKESFFPIDIWAIQNGEIISNIHQNPSLL